MRHICLLALVVLLAGCKRESPQQAADDFHLRDVMLPHGQTIKAETMTSPRDLLRGLMFRDSLAPDHGMLFVHAQPGHYSYWMYQMRIPLDTIWMDSDRRIVAISENLPPCKTQASQCPQYGGTETSAFEIQLAGGMARKYGLKVGDTIQW